MENLTYSVNGDYLIPDLTLREQPEETLGKYGLMRRTYLKEHRRILYNSLLLKERLYPHLLEIDRTANRRLEQLMTELSAKHPAPDKRAGQMEWVRHQNSLKQQAEELILTELVYR